MRVKIVGDSESPRVIRAYLQKAGIAVSERLPKFALSCTIHLSEHSGPSIIVDSIDSPLEMHILRHITELTKKDIILRRGTESPAIVSTANEIHISVPVGEPELAHAVEVGVLRGVQRAHFHRPWYRRLLPVVAFALLLPTLASAQYQTGNTTTRPFSGVPSGSCNSFQFAVDTTNGDFYNCLFSAWHKISSGAGGASSFDLLTTGVNISATMTVGSGGTLTFSGSGVNNASQINGVAVTNAPATGQIAIATSPTTAVWADPVVSGPDANAGVPSGNPLVTAGWDGTNIRRYKTDSAGVLQINQTGGSVTLNTTSPLTGGGTVAFGSALTFACPTCVVSALTNPMTTAGDIIIGGASGAPSRLGAGTTTQLLHSGSSGPSWSAIAQADVTNGYDDLSSAQNIGGAKTLTGESAAGNIGLKNASGDHIQYVSLTGNDANDGLSWGTAKLTPQTAINTATGSGANNGVVYLTCGSFTGPATFYSGLSLISDCGWQVPGVAQTAFTYTTTAGVTLASVSGMYWRNIVLDFNYNGGGMNITNAVQSNAFDNLTLKNCGDITVDCMKWLTTGVTNASNDTFNQFDGLYIYPTNVAAHYANCITMSGSGAVNAAASAFPTNNFINNGVCFGNINNGLVFRINTDTNYLTNFFIINLGPAQTNSACLVINDITPATDQDADGGHLNGLGCQGSFTNTFRMGQTSGWDIIMTSASGAGLAVLGGSTPLFTLHTIGLPGQFSDIQVGGRLTVSAIAGSPAVIGAVNGDMTVARSSTLGVLYLGGDGAQILRTGNQFFYICGSGTAGCSRGTIEVASPSGVASQGFDWYGSDDHLYHYNQNNGGVQTVPYRVTMASSSGAVTSTTLGQPGGMTALTWNVAAGRTYQFGCDMYYQISSVTGVPSPAMALGGTATMTSMWAVADGYQTATLTTEGTVTTAVATKSTLVTTASTPVTTNLPFKYHGAFTVNAAGTVLIQAANFLNAGASMTIGTLGSCTLQ